LGVRAVEALLEGVSGKMAGVSGGQVVLRPLSEAWEFRSVFDPKFLRLAHVLAS
jgi:hypothetical protein